MNHSGGFINVSRRAMVTAALSLMLIAPSSLQAAQDTGKVGVVDFGKLIQQLPETKQAETTLQATAAPLQKELARLNAEYQKSVVAYRQLPAATTKAARDQKEQEVNSKAQALQKYQQEQGGVVERKQQELLTPIREKVLSAVKAIAQQDGFTLVIDKGAQVYGTPDHDLTFKVMNQLNIK
ncbi:MULTISPECIES: OmpH family outer membrane protein [Chlorobium]|uniref:Outer membrane chaperone Skp (OmpH) n=1 Tax=Chlorobium ferrooxidans DSM 13031 TaxID=377431 RepID=Q0YSK8_9CHLB|nr:MULTISPECIES: OmpH family outer membrane protein [Chlorobium]EAT59191.1 Outer membrane chaperone Skp (OmpH) [Chlorobium ferrooxidans DSM 13031]